MTNYAIAMPSGAIERERLRQLTPDGVIPAIVAGSVEFPCTQCRVPLAVGPRVQAAMAADPAMVLLCPVCVAHVADGTENVVHLNNPDSRPESPTERDGWRGPIRSVS